MYGLHCQIATAQTTQTSVRIWHVHTLISKLRMPAKGLSPSARCLPGWPTHHLGAVNGKLQARNLITLLSKLEALRHTADQGTVGMVTAAFCVLGCGVMPILFIKQFTTLLAKPGVIRARSHSYVRVRKIRRMALKLEGTIKWDIRHKQISVFGRQGKFQVGHTAR